MASAQLRGRCQPLPTCASNSSSISWNRAHHILFRHPHYDQTSNLLFTLHAPDHAQGGLDHETAHTICAIFAGNRADGYLSETSTGPGIATPRSSILRGSEYYFHVPGSTSKEPYEVVPTFASWSFPPSLPPRWPSIPIALSDTPPGPSNTTTQVHMRDGTCQITGHAEGVEGVHLIPRAEATWFRRNQMNAYLSFGNSGLDDMSNLFLLRADLHSIFDAHKFTFAPKFPSHDSSSSKLVVHVLRASKELVNLYHNVQLQPLKDIFPEFLFARFALSLFSQLQEFLLRGVPRRLSVVDNTGVRHTRWFSAAECKNIIQPKRSASPKKRRPNQQDVGTEDASEADGYDFDSASSDLSESQPEAKRARHLSPSPSPEDLYKPSGPLSASPRSATALPSSPAAPEGESEAEVYPERETELHPEGQDVAQSEGTSLEQLRARHLEQERARSGDNGRWSRERDEWLEEALNRTLFSGDMPRLFGYWGYEMRSDDESSVT